MNRHVLSRRRSLSLAMRLAAAAAFAGLAVGAVTSPAQAQQLVYKSPSAPTAPAAGFFVGLGGSYNSVNFSNQNIFAQGVSNVYQGGTVVASGAAGGPTDPYSSIQSTFAPTAQMGYFQHFPSSDWLWGAKFSYSYLGTTATNQNVSVPQAGSFNGAAFTGHVIARSYQTNISHQMAFIPFVGHSFERSFIYFGAGPSLSQTQSSLNGVIGFADLNGVHTDITGTADSFASSSWVFGGAALIGATYFFDRFWFLDFSYTYAATLVQTTGFSAPFSSSSFGYTDAGILSGTYSGRAITQSVALSINRVF